MKRLVIALALLAGAKTALACTAYLTSEKVVEIKREGGYVRKLRFCYYDHLGDPMMLTVPANSFCSLTINVRHDNE